MRRGAPIKGLAEFVAHRVLVGGDEGKAEGKAEGDADAALSAAVKAGAFRLCTAFPRKVLLEAAGAGAGQEATLRDAGLTNKQEVCVVELLLAGN